MANIFELIFVLILTSACGAAEEYKALKDEAAASPSPSPLAVAIPSPSPSDAGQVTEVVTKTTISTQGNTVGEPGLHSVWTDPDSGDQWQFAATSKIFADATCPPGYRIPTASLPLKFHDYFAAFESTLPTNAVYWTAIGGTIGEIVRPLTDSENVIDDAPVTDRHLVICVASA